ncbi:hypothetical protein RF371_11645 [Companilactobacillus paralimentarius]|uniref:hypothetical protein n=1 Tax=Companilactobacillus paralimentarius TaxID=83526 RepID=UPI0028530803|nr:hypothetical protein [Companilactobacillus paralimentarius]MDR4934445.1 hypothetical protein [Companilactobacillus paralimentarius]
MTNSVVSTVLDIEAEYGTVLKCPINDNRLVAIRKFLNNGNDPIEKRSPIGIDLKVAQKLLNSKLTKQEIANILGIKEYRLQGYINDAYLDDTIWHTFDDKRNKSRNSKYRMFKNGDYIGVGTIKELAELTHKTVQAISYYHTEKYKLRKHTDRFRLVKVE